MIEDKDRTIYSVTELTRDVKFVLEDSFRQVWVEGEVSNFKAYSSGHMYFSIKDENSVLKCVMFRNANASLKFKLEDGMHVLLCGKISVYEKRGDYQLYVNIIEPRGKGALQIAFEQLKAKLSKEGLFDEAHKKPLPFLPAHVGVVTSATGAAIRDILNVAKRRFTNIEITIRPVKVQGDEAKDDIVQALKEFNEFNNYIIEKKKKDHPVDVIILGRGGGSLEDLWPFNEEKVAKAIYESEIPIISAVGHQIDFTISDFVADFRAPTPSAAAELVIPVKRELKARVEDCAGKMRAALRSKLNIAESELKNLKESYILRTPMNLVLQLGQQIDDFTKTATKGIKYMMEIKKQDLGRVAGKLDMLSPLSVLERGYSITFKDDSIIRDSAVLKKGDLIHSRFLKGKTVSRVEHLDKE